MTLTLTTSSGHTIRIICTPNRATLARVAARLAQSQKPQPNVVAKAA